jgi:hypothetical protein
VITRSLFVVLFALALLAAPARSERVPTLGTTGLVPGQRAEVRTVFAGQRVESFDAEIVGVLRGGRAGGEMILARATSERVIRTGVAAGMSGSPVYVDGRLIGALSSGWPFSREPIFGITPIGEMLDVLDHPIVEGDGATTGPAGVMPAAGQARYRELAWPAGTSSGREASVPPAATDVTTPAPLSIPLIGVGLPPAALELARQTFAGRGMQVVPGGSGAGGTADSLRPGSAVAVDLMRGDLSLSAIGTVSWRDGDRVLIFGHPFFQSGSVRLPMSTAEITTIVASDLSSFKLGVAGREIGVIEQDRRAAVAGRIGGRAAMLPVRVTIRRPGRAPQAFRFESIEDRTVAPALVSIASFTSLLESGGTAGNETMSWRLTLHRTGAGPFVIQDVVASESPAAGVAQRSAQPLQFLFNNPCEALRLDSLSLDVDVQPGRRMLSLERATLLTPVVRPGDVVRVRCDLDAWRGGARRAVLEVPVPASLPAGTYDMWVGGGHERSALSAQRRPARFEPATLDEAWRRLGELPPSNELHAVLIARDTEWTLAGRDYPGLPPSVRGLLAGRALPGAREGAGWLAEARALVDGSLSGQTLLKLTVEDRVP